MSQFEFKICSLDEIQDVSQSFIKTIGEYRKFAFYGEMGVGKTTFIKSLLDILEIHDHSSSPTFSIINEYFSVNYGKIYHLDCYRLEEETEAYDIGIEDIFNDDSFTFIEWPEKIENLLPENCVKISITEENNCRIIRFQL